MIFSPEWMVSRVWGTVPLRRGKDNMLAVSAEVYCTGAKNHDSFGMHKLKKAKRGKSRF